MADLTHRFILSLDVFDAQQLLAAAQAHEDGKDFDLTPDGEMDIAACLITLLDPGTLPGCSINWSEVDQS